MFGLGIADGFRRVDLVESCVRVDVRLGAEHKEEHHLAPNNVIHGTPDAILGAGLKPTAGVTDVSFRTFLSIVKSAQRRRRCCYSQHSAIIGVFDNVDGLRDSRVFRVDGRLPTMTCAAVAVQQSVDRTPRGAFNRPF